ncbi:hypothetical protein K1719_047282 [Acacia pycnantha]|nr:hypothetical protein K1719_047282 [Acacia pycnantha]
MEEREQEREREMERKLRAEQHPGENEPSRRPKNRRTSTAEAIEVDQTSAAQSATGLTPERIEAFNSLFGQHMRANRLDLITISDIENVVNQGAESSYSREDISVLLEVTIPK